MGKSQRRVPRSPPRQAPVEHQQRESWVKHGHKKLYLFGGVVRVAIILGAWALSISPAKG